MMKVMAWLLFDADCGFCQRTLTRFGRFLRSDVQPLPLQDWRSADPRLQPDQLRKAITLVLADGRVLTGAEAIARAIGGIGRVYYAPGVRQLADRTYAWVARNRFRLPGGCVVERSRAA